MTKQIKSILVCCKELILFALPIIIGEVGQIMFGIGDIIVAGRYSTEILAALGAACGFYFPFLILGMGVMYAISPVKAKYMGEKQDTSSFPKSSLILACITGVILVSLLELLTFFLDRFSLEPALVPLITTYLRICALSLLPVFIFGALKENLLAYGKTVFPNSLILIFNGVNIAGNILLMVVFDLGIAGLALATLTTRSLMALSLYIYTRNKLSITKASSPKLIVELAKRGIPIGMNNLMSGLIFCVIAVMAAQFSILDSAANNIVLNMTSVTFMIPFALSGVSAVKIGRAYGEKDVRQIKRYTCSAILLSFVISSTVAILFYTIPEELTRLATNDENVIGHVVTIMFFVALYQIPDALQITILGILRGVDIIRRPLLLGFTGIWVIGLPAAYYFAYEKEMGAAGLWAGLSIGLAIMASLLIALLCWIYLGLARNIKTINN